MTKPDKDQFSGASAGMGADCEAATPAPQDAPAGTAPSPEQAEGDGAADASDETAEFELDPELVAEAAAAVAGVETESELVAQAKAEAADWQDKYVRLHAEWDTYRRRTNEQREAEKVRAAEKLVTSLLPVLDDFERTISYAKDNGEKGLLGGVEAVQAKLIDTLMKGGVEVIDPAGEAFDALEAQAVATVPDDTVPDETVAQVYQKGYRMGTKVLRAAMVTVTTGGPKREKPAESQED